MPSTPVCEAHCGIINGIVIIIILKPCLLLKPMSSSSHRHACRIISQPVISINARQASSPIFSISCISIIQSSMHDSRNDVAIVAINFKRVNEAVILAAWKLTQQLARRARQLEAANPNASSAISHLCHREVVPCGFYAVYLIEIWNDGNACENDMR